MFMQKIRKSTQKNRTILIIVVAVLTIGLVGSFAVWNSDDYRNETGYGEMTTEEQIATYEQYVADATPAAGVEMDYASASSLANYYTQLRSLYYTASTEYAATDTAKSTEYYDKSIDAATKAAEYFQFQLDNAPENMNDYAKALLMGNRASALSFTGEMDEARALYEEAVTLSPDNFEVAQNYVTFIYSQDGIDAAKEYAEQYKEMVGEESDNYAAMDEVIKYYESVEEFYKNLEQVKEEEAAAEGENADENADENTGDTEAADEEEEETEEEAE